MTIIKNVINKTIKKTIPLGLVVAVASAFMPLSVQSEELPVRGPISFAAYDQDNSGFITEEEFNTVRLKRIETNAAQGWLMRGAATAPDFSVFDLDADGKLTPDELAVGQQAQMDKRREMGMGQGRGMGNGKGQGQGQGMGMGMNMPAFSDYDLDGDGKLLEDEFNTARNQRIDEREQQGYQMRNRDNAPTFADIDANGNGEISAEEFAAHQSQRRQNGTR
jgi:Ca2+-binding EF-hand superfamily protein